MTDTLYFSATVCTMRGAWSGLPPQFLFWLYSPFLLKHFPTYFLHTTMLLIKPAPITSNTSSPNLVRFQTIGIFWINHSLIYQYSLCCRSLSLWLYDYLFHIITSGISTHYYSTFKMTFKKVLIYRRFMIWFQNVFAFHRIYFICNRKPALWIKEKIKVLAGFVCCF